MKKIVSVVALIIFFTSNNALAFCTWGIVPPGKVYAPLDATEAFLSYDDGVQTLVLRPEFKGDMDDFSIIFPTPNKPEVSDAPEFLFQELDSATNIQMVTMFLEDTESIRKAQAPASGETVTVVEEKQVGNYTVTVLTATDSTDLVDWLADNGYNFTKADSEKVDYYVLQEGFYFVALRVDMGEIDFPMPSMPAELELDEKTVSIDATSQFFGALDPIQITFETDRPQLPMRTLKSNMPEMTFDLYTLSDTALYIPGVDTIWSNVVDAEFLQSVPTLNQFAPKGKWLVRQEVRFDPAQSDEDLFLEKATNNIFEVVDPLSQIRIDPDMLNKNTGVISGERGKTVYIKSERTTFVFNRSLKIGSVGTDVFYLQQYLNTEGFLVAEDGAGSLGNETQYFGERTKEALIKFQNFYRADILEPVGLQFGTGYFGPSTISFISS